MGKDFKAMLRGIVYAVVGAAVAALLPSAKDIAFMSVIALSVLEYRWSR